MIVSFTRSSGNAKTGPIPTTMTERASCPDSCPFKDDRTCYPNFSPLGFQWIALESEGIYPGQSKRCIIPRTWDELCYEISRLPKRQLWRHNAAGDLPGKGDTIDTKLLDKLVEANSKSKAKGYTYTHKPVGTRGKKLANAKAIEKANKNGFCINLSADNLQEADQLADLGIAPVVVVVPSDAPRIMKTPKGRKVVACSHEYKDIQCDRCQRCANKDRNTIVSFHAHGTMKSAVDARLQKEEKLRLKVL